MPNFISEDQIERALVQKLQHLHGFDSLDCYTEDPEDLHDGSGRANKRDVILVDRVKEAAVRLNPDIPPKAIDDALEKLLDRRQAMSLVAANQDIYNLLRDGIPVEFANAKGQRQEDRVYLINFNEPDKNRYLAVTQLWIKGERGFRRPDVLLCINGIPLVFIELKNSKVKLKTAFDDNLTNYKKDIPQLFLTNAFCVLSNAIETKVGSITAEWEHFFDWLRADDEKEKIDRDEIKEKGTSLEGVIAGLFPRQRLLDYVENFVLYYKDNQKIIAQNHQFIGVNRAYDTFLYRKERERGVTFLFSFFSWRQPLHTILEPTSLNCRAQGISPIGLIDNPGRTCLEVQLCLLQSANDLPFIPPASFDFNGEALGAAIKYEIDLCSGLGTPKITLRVRKAQTLPAENIFQHEGLPTRPANRVAFQFIQ